MKQIVVIDFSGTLIKPFVAEEANKKRYEILGIPLSTEEEQKKSHSDKSHYGTIKEFVATTFGVEDDMQISAVQSYGGEIVLSGKDIKTNIMTDLFRNCMYGVANRHKKGIFTDGIIDALKDIQEKGYKLAIVSGVRTDIISGMLAIVRCPLTFDYIYGQDAVLSRDDNTQQLQELQKQGDIKYIVGDKKDDLEPARTVDAKAIFLRGGHPVGGEEEIADYSISSASELTEVIL